ncbi:MAG TPA: nucleotidyltransferase domain-containing protein [Candidatus Nanoarchaeia archaeon]|nr:nucleotidyltransferase domain-containing protein [Candidatus Nanoarchaeia archaeon]
MKSLLLRVLDTRNRNKEYFKIAKEYAKKISEYDGVIGVAVGGGIGRGHSDEYSDIDLFVFLDAETYKKWRKKSPIPERDHYYLDYWIETEFFDYDKEKKTFWRVEERWERKHHIILFDRDAKIKELYEKKLIFGQGEKNKMYKELYDKTGWYVAELPCVWLKRGDIAQAHYVMNNGIDWIIEYIFLQNNYFLPWGKWRLHYVFLMDKLPKDFKKNILEAMKIKEFTEKDVLRRQRILIKMLRQLGLDKE